MQPVDEPPRRNALITGAASGIGRATARLLARQGWFVGCIDVNAEALDCLAREVGADKASIYALDITDRASLIDAIDAFSIVTSGRLDLLLNNAGVDAKGRFDAMSWEAIVTVIDVNLIAGLSLIHSALALLKANPGSLCPSTSSASAIFGTANLAVYSATKHALKGFTEALSVELSTDRVRVADILPGIVDTGMLTEMQRGALPKEGLWRVLSAEAVAEVVWAAYHDRDRLQWYVPAELAQYDVEVTQAPEMTRNARLKGAN